MNSLTVRKCHGTGNDFVLLDSRDGPDLAYAGLARELCHRRFSLGADGLLVVEKTAEAGTHARMRIFNADGSEAEMCGNGIRCVARYLHEENPKSHVFDIATASGISRSEIVSWHGELGVRVCMGTPHLSAVTAKMRGENADGLAAYEVRIGNPHTVLFVRSSLESVDLEALASRLNVGSRQGRVHDPGLTNLEVAVVGATDIAMRVRERGVGETWACGSGACAVAVSAIEAGLATSPAIVRSKGGPVQVEWSGPGTPAWLTGDAHLVFRTTIPMPVTRAPVS